MKKNIWGLVVLATLVIESFCLAADSSTGCGVSWYIADKNTLVSSTTRVTTEGALNAMVPYITFAMTSGTSNCAKHSFVKKEDEQAAVFAQSNLHPLTIQMAEGRGEFLEGFARTLGCGDSSFAAFSKMTQSNFKSITENGNPKDGYDVYFKVKDQILKDPVLSATCRA